MDEFGDWIYIIIMVVVGISSLFSSKNKKKQQQQTQMPSPVPTEPSEPWFPTTHPAPKKKERKQHPSIQEQMNARPFNTHSTIPTVEADTQSETLRAQEEENALAIALDLDNPDSFRKAIIYSEILHRKY